MTHTSPHFTRHVCCCSCPECWYLPTLECVCRECSCDLARNRRNADTVAVEPTGNWLVMDGKVVPFAFDVKGYAGPQVHLIVADLNQEPEPGGN